MEKRMVEKLLCLCIGYLLGSVLTADIVGRICGRSVRDAGSGNPGMANTASVLGLRYGLIVLLGDFLKTAIACALCAWALFPAMGNLAVLYSGLGVLVGHSWPVWNGFRGGKGVASIAIVSLFFDPRIAIIAFAAAGLVALFSGYLALGSAALALLLVGLSVGFGYGLQSCLLVGALSLILLLRHRSNFKRMLRGQEKRFRPFRR